MSTETMTSKERILTAMRGGIPDTVPVQVGIYEMISAKMTGVPWRDIFLYHKVDLWHYNVATIKHFKFHGYLYVHLERDPGVDDQRSYERKIVRQDDRYRVQRTMVHAPDGDLWEERTAALGDLGAIGGTVGLPGLHHLTDLFDGRPERAAKCASRVTSA